MTSSARTAATRSPPTGRTASGGCSPRCSSRIGAAAGGVIVEGDDIAIDDRSATPLALLFHELATNATKYGALSVANGRVALTITAADAEAIIVWREQGGPRASEPASSGFGSQLVEMSAVRQLGGKVTRDWQDEGLCVSIRLPMASLRR